MNIKQLIPNMDFISSLQPRALSLQPIRALILVFVFAFSLQPSALSPLYAATKGNPPVAHWKFDEGGGSTAYDESTNNNDAALLEIAKGYLARPTAFTRRLSNSFWSSLDTLPNRLSKIEWCNVKSLFSLNRELFFKPVWWKSGCVDSSRKSVGADFVLDGTDEINANKISSPWGSGEIIIAGRTLREDRSVNGNETRIISPRFKAIVIPFARLGLNRCLLQDYPGSQMPCLFERVPQSLLKIGFSGPELQCAPLYAQADGVSLKALNSRFHILLQLAEPYSFASLIKSTIPKYKCQSQYSSSGQESASGERKYPSSGQESASRERSREASLTVLDSAFGLARTILVNVSQDVRLDNMSRAKPRDILRAAMRAHQASGVEKPSQGFSTGLTNIALTSARTVLRYSSSLSRSISAWLCPDAYAATKGNPPVAHWKFDEGGGGTAYDESSNNNDGTLYNHTKFVSGKIGKALQFDGTDDYVSVSNNATLQPASAMTISFWMKMTSTQSGWQTVVGKNPYTGGYLVFIETGGALLRYLANINSTEYRLNSNFAPALNTWYHVSFVVDPANTIMRSYINGVLNATVAIPNNTITHNANPLSFAGGGTNYFNGIIDDARIYNYSRTPEQVLQDFNAGFSSHLGAGADPNEGNPPIGYWPMDENTGTTAYDRSGSGNNGTFNGDAAWTGGKYGNGVAFDGNGDWVSIPDSASLDTISASGSIEAWIYITSLPSNGSSDSNLAAIATGHTSAYFEVYNYSALTTYPRLGLWRSSPTSLWTLGATDLRGKTGQWLHAACTWDGTGAKIYLNGQLDGSDANGGVAGVVGASGFGIGRNPAVTRYFNGKIDDVKIYNYARSAGQIAYDYNRGKPVAHYRFDEGAGAIGHNEYSTADTGPAPVGWWRMDNASSGSANGATISDLSGNANNGTAAYGANATGMSWTSGKIGPGALNFDGVDDRVDLGNKSIIDGLANVTVTAWVYIPVLNADHHRVFSEEYILYVGHYGNQVSFYMSNTGTTWPNYSVSMGTLTAATWQFVAWVKEGTTGRVYINGVHTNTMTAPAVLGSTSNANYLGTYTGLSQYWDGYLDDVRVYNYARTSEQIYNDYKTTHGTLVGDTKFVDGKIGKALQFDGNGDYVTVPDSANLSFSNAFTVSMWFKATALGAAIITKSISDANENFRVYINTNDVYFDYGSGSQYARTSTFLITTGTWYHFTGTVVAGSPGKIYINGQEAGSYSVQNASSNPLPTNTNPVQIGCATFVPYYFNGLIDDVRIYNYSRTAEQILQDYNAGLGARLGAQSAGEADPWGGAMPVAYWKLDENTGVLANDASGNGKNGALINGPVWAQGRQGPCLNFDGVNDQVQAASVGVNTGAGTYNTVEFWMYWTGGYNGFPIELGGYRLWMPSPNFGFNTGNGDCYGITATGLENQWVHVTAVFYNGAYTGNSKIYINGVLQALSQKVASAQSGTAGTTVTIAGYAAGASSYPFPGRLDDIKIYNYERTQAQVAWDYNAGKPVGHWRFNEGSGATAYDESNNNNDGTISGASWTSSGKFGKALSFNGSSYVRCGNASSLNTDELTVEAWVYSSNWGSQNQPMIVAKGINQEWILWKSDDGSYDEKFAFRVSPTGGSTIYGTTMVQGNTWYHVAGRYSKSDGIMRLYVNGIQEAQAAGVTSTLSTGIREVTIGAGNSGTVASPVWSNYFTGTIDDARVYNYARTAEQISQDYNNGLAARLSD